MANQYKNKVVYFGETLIDLSSDTVTAETLLEGYTAHRADGAVITGTYVPSAAAITVITTPDSHGGVIKEIIAVDISNDTVTAATLLSGYTAHDNQGNAITGEYVPPAVVNVQSNKNATPTESSQEITPDYGYDALAKVTVSAISSSYVGSGIDRRSSTDLEVSGATVSVPAGYYASSASKTVASGSVTAPASITGSSATVSTGTNTLTFTKTVSVTPSVTSAGYISSGTAGNSSVSLTASVTTLGATTYNVSSSNQTIASGTYLTGTQTIRAVTTSGISAANIKVGVTVKVGDSADDDRIAGVTGTFTSDANATASDIASGKTAYVNGSKLTGELAFVTYRTGSGAPSSSLGVDGDIYLQTS